MTPEKLDELYALAKKATGGPWSAFHALIDANAWGVESLCAKAQEEGNESVIENSRLMLMKNALYIAAANPSAIIALISDNRSRRNMLDMVINSVAAALERAGVKAVDDPGEAIDVLIADKDKEIARLRTVLDDLIRDHHSPLDTATTTYFWNQARAALNKE